MKTPKQQQVVNLECSLLLIHLLICCSSPNSPELTNQDREFLQNVYANIGKSWNEGNRNPYLDRYIDNTVYMVPNQELLSDKTTIEKFVNAFPKLNAEFKTIEIWGSSTNANVRGVFSATDPQGSLFDKGKFLSLWQKDGEGNWKITHDIWNSDLPATTPIEGGWYLISGEYSGNKRDDGSEPYQFKMFSKSHFSFLMQSNQGNWNNAAAGNYYLSGDKYIETFEFSTNAERIGLTAEWKYSVQGDTLKMEGPIKIVDKEGKENDEWMKNYNTMKEIRIRAK